MFEIAPSGQAQDFGIGTVHILSGQEALRLATLAKHYLLLQY